MPKSMSPSESPIFDTELIDITERDVDAAIEACHGDARGAIRALLIAYALLEQDLAARVSPGYERRPARSR